jgi:hypothetical protein
MTFPRPISFYFLIGYPIYSSMKIVNGTYRIYNDQPTGEYGDAIFKGGVIRTIILNANIGGGLIYPLTKSFLLDVGVVCHWVNYSSVSGLLGDNREVYKRGILDDEQLWLAGSSLNLTIRVGLSYKINFKPRVFTRYE